jgi:hypothetical protein
VISGGAGAAGAAGVAVFFELVAVFFELVAVFFELVAAFFELVDAVDLAGVFLAFLAGGGDGGGDDGETGRLVLVDFRGEVKQFFLFLDILSK